MRLRKALPSAAVGILYDRFSASRRASICSLIRKVKTFRAQNMRSPFAREGAGAGQRLKASAVVSSDASLRVEGNLSAAKWVVAAVAASAANVAFAAAVALGAPLGEPLGRVLGGTALGSALGNLLGAQLGAGLPLASVGLLGVSAASLAFGIYIVKRKKHR